MLLMISIVPLAPERLAALDIFIPSLAKGNVPPPRLHSAGFVRSLLLGPHFTRVFTVVDQGLQPAGLSAGTAKIPCTSIPNREPDGFAE